MNRPATFAVVRSMILAAAVPLLMVGCNETDDIPADAFRITPASAHLAKSGDSVVLEAVGGLEPLTWTVSATNGELGTLSGSGRTVTFIRSTASGANVVQVADKRTWTASATIYLDPSDPSAAPSALSITPSSATLSDNRDTSVFVAVGGVEPFAWSLADGLLGHLSAGSGRQIVYTRDRPGDNTVILTDGSNTVAIALVSQPDTTDALAVSPTSATLANNGDTTVFLAAGGTAPYTWYVGDATRGHLSGNTGDSVVYTRDAEGNNTVVLTDRFGNTVVASVVQSVPATLTIVPGNATLNYTTDTVVFVANGGLPPYRWNVADTNRGVLSAGSGNSVTYTRVGPGNNTVTLRDNDAHTATAIVTQPSFGLAVTPSSATLATDGDSVVLIVAGGLPPYNWSLTDGTRGTLSSTTGSPITYTRTTSGNNSVVLGDASGQTAVVAVSQPATPPLAISPATASVSTNSGSQVFTASGGLGTYTWSFVTPASGVLTPTTGANVVYTSNNGDSDGDVIQVTDGTSTAFATITKN